MPKSHFLQTSFASGELSPLLRGRTDLEQYYAGLSTAENVVIVPQGGVKRRPGTEHIDKPINIIGPYLSSQFTATMPKGGTVANINDFNPATKTLTTSAIDANEYVVAHYDMSATTLGMMFIDVLNIQLSVVNANTASFKIQTSSNNSTWTDRGSISVSSEAQSLRVKITDTVATPYVRLVRLAAAWSGATQYVSIGALNVQYDNLSFSDVKTFDFSVEDNRHYLCVATGGGTSTPPYSATNPPPVGNLAIYRIPYETITETVLVANLSIPYRFTEIAKVRDVQTENVMLMFHENYASQRIINTGDSFAIDEIPYLNVPQYDYNDALSPIPVTYQTTMTLNNFSEGDRFQIDVEGVISKTITRTGSAASSAASVQRNLQDMPVFGDSGVTVTSSNNSTFVIQVSGESAKNFEQWSGFPTSDTQGANNTVAFVVNQQGSPRKEDVWSANRGYPRMGTFHEGRLWLGGAKSKTQSLFASKAGSFFDFFFEEGDDDEGMFLNITSRSQTEIVDINSDRGLQVFTTGAEFLVKGNTPTTVSIISQTQHGSSYLEAKSLDGATLFVDQNGKTLRQYVFNFNEDAYTSNDISVLSSQLIDVPQDVAVLSGTTAEDSNWVFIINQDGNGAVLNTVRAQDINGFTSYINSKSGYFTGDVEIPRLLVSASVVKNELYVVTRYITDGTNFRYSLDRWSFNHLLDASVKINNVSSTTVSLGHQHLNGAIVNVIGNGNNLDKRTVSNTGTITLTAEELSSGNLNLEVGLNFVVKVVPMPLNTSTTATAPNAMREKKITRMNIRVYESAGVYVDGNPVPIRNFGDSADSPLGTPFEIRTGIIQDNNGGNGWGIDVVPTITIPDPAPLHLQAIEYEVESS